MEGHTVRWFLIGFGIAIAATVAGMVIAGMRRREPVVGDDAISEAPELQPVS